MNKREYTIDWFHDPTWCRTSECEAYIALQLHNILLRECNDKKEYNISLNRLCNYLKTFKFTKHQDNEEYLQMKESRTTNKELLEGRWYEVDETGHTHFMLIPGGYIFKDGISAATEHLIFVPGQIPESWRKDIALWEKPHPNKSETFTENALEDAITILKNMKIP